MGKLAFNLTLNTVLTGKYADAYKLYKNDSEGDLLYYCSLYEDIKETTETVTTDLSLYVLSAIQEKINQDLSKLDEIIERYPIY